MPTPGEILDQLLRERGLGKTEFARQVTAANPGYTCRYDVVNHWTNDERFTPENQARAARAARVPHNYFDRPSDARRRELTAQVLLDDFLATSALAERLPDGAVDILRSIRFDSPDLPPSRAFFEAVAYALLGEIRANEVLKVARENAGLDRALADKPPLRRR